MHKNDQDMIHALKKHTSTIAPPPELKHKVMKSIELMNEQGRRLALIDVDTLTEDDPMDSVLLTMKPGTGKAIYIVDHNPAKTISNQTCYEAEHWPNDLHELSHAMAYANIKLPKLGEPQSVKVMYGFDPLEAWQVIDMYREAELSGKRVIVRDLRKNDRLVGVVLEYDQDPISFELRILTTTKSRIHVPDINEHIIIRTKVGGKPAVYLTDTTMSQLIWIDDEQEVLLQYEIRARHATREHILNIASNVHNGVPLEQL